MSATARRALGLASVLMASFSAGAARAAVEITVRDISPDPVPHIGSPFFAHSGGRVNGLAMAADGSGIYAASEWGGLFKSTDAGRNWHHLPGHAPTVTNDVAVDPRNPRRVYATSFYDGRVTSLAGINVSEDGGETWTHPPTATPPPGFCADTVPEDEPAAYGIAFDERNPDRVFIGTYCGLAISEDAGRTWRYVHPVAGDAYKVWDVLAHRDSADDHLILDICGDGSFFRTDDLGLSWRPGFPGAGIPPFGRCSLAASPDESDVLFMVVGTTIYDSIDAGRSWRRTLTNPRPHGRIPFLATNRRFAGGFDLWFGDVDLTRVRCVSAPGSADPRCPAGAWSPDLGNLRGAHPDAGTLLFEPGAAADACPLFHSNDGGVYRNTLDSSPECHTPLWEQPERSPHALWAMDMSGVDRRGGGGAEDLYLGTQDNGMFVTLRAADPSPPWAGGAVGDVYDVDADDALGVYGSFLGGEATLFDRGATSPRALANHPPGLRRRTYMPTDSFSRIGTDSYAFITDQGVFYTPDISGSPVEWRAVGRATMPMDACHVVVSANAATAEPVLLVKTGDCFPWAEGRLWRHQGLAESGPWEEVPLPAAGGVAVFGIDPHDARRLIASFVPETGTPSMVRTVDGGAVWEDLPALDRLMTADGAFKYINQTGYNQYQLGVGTVQPSAVAFDPENPDYVAAGGADTGVFLSRDGGRGWMLLTGPATGSPGGAPHIPRPLFIHFDHEAPPADHFHQVTLYVGSQGRGVWRIDVSEPTVSGCFSDPALCIKPHLDLGLLELRCPRGRLFELNCRAVDPLPQNCLVKFDCPGCLTPNSLCPPFYHLFFDDFDPSIWNVGLFTGQGSPVPFDLFKIGPKSVVVSFRPEKERFIEGRIGDYALGFWMTENGKPGKYRFKVRLEVGDAPFQPQ